MVTNPTEYQSPRSYRSGCWVFAATTVVLLSITGGWWLWNATLLAEVKSNVSGLLNAQQDAWNAGDLDGFMAGYRMADDITFYSGDKVEAGWVGLRDRYDKKYRSGGQSMGKLTFSDLAVDVLATDAAVARGRWKVEWEDRAASGLFTLLLRKYPEGWRIIHDHTSSGS